MTQYILRAVDPVWKDWQKKNQKQASRLFKAYSDLFDAYVAAGIAIKESGIEKDEWSGLSVFEKNASDFPRIYAIDSGQAVRSVLKKQRLETSFC